jgi:hypothetical protein
MKTGYCQHKRLHEGRFDGTHTVCFDCECQVSIQSSYFADWAATEEQYQKALDRLGRPPCSILSAWELVTCQACYLHGEHDRCTGSNTLGTDKCNCMRRDHKSPACAPAICPECGEVHWTALPKEA